MFLVIYECSHVWILSNLDKNDLFLGLSSLFAYLKEANANRFLLRNIVRATHVRRNFCYIWSLYYINTYVAYG